MNGIESMRATTDLPRVLSVSSEPWGAGGVLVTVQDTGGGLDPAIAERIFDPLFTTKPKGMGMGLAICRSMVEAHGGRMWASANEPRGAVFQFTLPLQRDESIPAQHVRPNSAA
jgi:signal transduction histidine kinase